MWNRVKLMMSLVHSLRCSWIVRSAPKTGLLSLWQPFDSITVIDALSSRIPFTPSLPLSCLAFRWIIFHWLLRIIINFDHDIQQQQHLKWKAGGDQTRCSTFVNRKNSRSLRSQVTIWILQHICWFVKNEMWGRHELTHDPRDCQFVPRPTIKCNYILLKQFHLCLHRRKMHVCDECNVTRSTRTPWTVSGGSESWESQGRTKKHV